MEPRQIAKATAPGRRRTLLGFARGVIRRIYDAPKAQELQIEAFDGEVLPNPERFQEYGFSSVPLEGAEVAIGFVTGDRSHGIVVAVEDRPRRPRRQPAGSVCLYTQEDDPEAQPEDAAARLALVDDTLVVRFAGKIDLKVGDSQILIEPSGITITAARVDFVRA